MPQPEMRFTESSLQVIEETSSEGDFLKKHLIRAFNIADHDLQKISSSDRFTIFKYKKLLSNGEEEWRAMKISQEKAAAKMENEMKVLQKLLAISSSSKDFVIKLDEKIELY
jgi:hypothetical protein